MIDPNKVIFALATSVVGHVLGMICVTCISTDAFTKGGSSSNVLRVATNDLDDSIGGEVFDDALSQPVRPTVEMVVFGQPDKAVGIPRPAKSQVVKTSSKTSAPSDLDGTVHFVSMQSEPPGFMQKRTHISRSWQNAAWTEFSNPKLQRTEKEFLSPSVAPVKTSGLIAETGKKPPRIWRSYPPEAKTNKPEPTPKSPTVFISHTMKKAVVPEVARVTAPIALPGNPVPRFPNFHRFQGQSGFCELRVTVNARGNVSGVAIMRTSGNESLDAASVAAVSRWRYRPATEDGNFVTGEVLERIHFFVR